MWRHIVLLAALLTPTIALAAADPRDGDIEDIRLGMPASALSTERYMEFACGTAGGPPGRALAGWVDFAACPRDKSTGLHEVAFRFDDEAEYIARARRDTEWLGRYGGTRLAGQPVLLSLLFDDAGIVRGMRIVSDDRADVVDRKTANLFGLRLMQRYDEDGWTCIDRPPSAGRTPIGGTYLDRDCTKIFNGDRTLSLNIRQFRRAGQRGLDPNGNYAPGQFENSVRLDIVALPAASGQSPPGRGDIPE